MIVDFQHHYVPAELAERYGASAGSRQDVREQGVKKVTLHDKLCDLDEQIKDMDAAGIDVAVLSCLLAWDAPLEVCRLVNEKMAEAQERYRGRFVGLAHFPGPDRKGLRELERAVRELGLRGAAITSQVNRLPLDAPELGDFYRKVVELDIAVFVHPAMVPRGYDLALDYDLARILAREFDLALAATRLIAGRVLESFPALKMVIAHFGGGIAAIKERIAAKAWRFGTALPRPFDYYFDKLYFDMAGFEGGAAALRSALAGIRPERLVFATDYPQDFTGATTDTGKGIDGIKRYIADVRALGLPPGLAERMLGLTAAELLKL